MAKPRIPKKVSDDSRLTPAAEVAANVIAAAESNGNGGATKPVRKRTAAKPEIVKSEARATLLPINLEDEIRRLAYLLAERPRRCTGDDNAGGLRVRQSASRQLRGPAEIRGAPPASRRGGGSHLLN